MSYASTSLSATHLCVDKVADVGNILDVDNMSMSAPLKRHEKRTKDTDNFLVTV
jgi:hypothetical protein